MLLQHVTLQANFHAIMDCVVVILRLHGTVKKSNAVIYELINDIFVGLPKLQKN
jgi:hypothetical protein